MLSRRDITPSSNSSSPLNETANLGIIEIRLPAIADHSILMVQQLLAVRHKPPLSLVGAGDRISRDSTTKHRATLDHGRA